MDNEEKVQNNEVVQLTKSQFDSIMADLSALKNRGAVKKPKRVTEHTATLRFHNDKPVVWYGNIRELKDKDTGRLVAWMDIKVLGSEKVINVPYLEFLNGNNRVQVKILKQTAEEIVKSFGNFRAENPDPAQISNRNWRANEVEEEVRSYKYTSVVEVIDGEHTGEQYTISNDALNS